MAPAQSMRTRRRCLTSPWVVTAPAGRMPRSSTTAMARSDSTVQLVLARQMVPPRSATKTPFPVKDKRAESNLRPFCMDLQQRHGGYAWPAKMARYRRSRDFCALDTLFSQWVEHLACKLCLQSRQSSPNLLEAGRQSRLQG